MNARIIKTEPANGVYFAEEVLQYASGKEGTERGIVNIYEDVQYQQMIGFGAAITESAAYNYSLLSPEDKKRFLELYYSREKGIGYNFGRTCINSSDFGLDVFCYVQEGDETLETFNIDRDRKYVIPMLKDILAYTQEEVMLFASPWSPPAYMKDNNSPVKGGSVKPEYKRLWALYYTKYIKAYAEEGITISAISVQNEPKAKQTWESCYYSAEDEREFIRQYLAPVLEEEGLGHIKIIIWDHNKERVYDRAREIFTSKEVEERVWAVAHHWYSGDHFEAPRLVHEKYGKPLISTEICGSIYDDPHDLAEQYGREICENCNSFMGAFCDWNILLDQEGGPFHLRVAKDVVIGGVVFESKSRGCHAPVLYDTEKKELKVTDLYYYIGHFSKYVQRGAYRIATTKYRRELNTCAFQNPDGSIVLVIQNNADTEVPVNVRHQDTVTPTALAPRSIATIILN